SARTDGALGAGSLVRQRVHGRRQEPRHRSAHDHASWRDVARGARRPRDGARRRSARARRHGHAHAPHKGRGTETMTHISGFPLPPSLPRALVLACAGLIPAGAQVGGSPTSGVYVVSDGASLVPQLRRNISLSLSGVPVETALREISRRADVPITYNDLILPK